VQSHVAGFDGRLEEVRGRSPPATIWAPDIILDLNCLSTSGKSRGAVELFNSAVFCFVFLPATLAGYYIFNGCGLGRWAIAWLVFASAVFYGWFSVPYLGMLAVLILFNYAMGVVLSRDFRAKRQRPALLIAGIAVNVAALGYFKYAGFFVGNANVLFGRKLYCRSAFRSSRFKRSPTSSTHTRAKRKNMTCWISVCSSCISRN
jgi:hypothetical protein